MAERVRCVTFYCVKWIKGHAYVYRQTNRREGRRVVSDCTYIGPAAGARPYGATRGSLDPEDVKTQRRVREKIKRSLSIDAELLAREMAKSLQQDKKARRIRRVRFRLGALEHLDWDSKLWRRL